MAAALTSYFPSMCRSHLAQPARCLEEEYSELPSAGSLRSRRQQLIERCAEPRARAAASAPRPGAGTGRPAPDGGKPREELASAARTNVKKINVESGWSKVEEVRKKFEAQATASFSRSFESPPRRRLADSLFASFKLPRRKEPAAMGTQPRAQHTHKRKSAVELLAESKAFYVKSETVLDRKQELPLRVNSGLGQAIVSGGGCHLVSSTAPANDVICLPYATATLGRIGGARRTVSAGEGLQSTLRRLLDHADSRENVYSPPLPLPLYAVPHKIAPDARGRGTRDAGAADGMGSRSHTSGTVSATSSSGTSGSKPRTKSDPDHAYNNKNLRPLSFGDARVFFPESFVIPRQRPNEPVLLKNTYSIPSSYSSPEQAEECGTCEEACGVAEVCPISPPAQYAHSTHSRYIRSNSHTQGVSFEEESSNINSHKSLPDLHAQANHYNDQASMSGADTVGRSPRRRRRASHHRTASCSSKGTRSNHSSIVSSCDAFSEHPSPGDGSYPYNSRCGSSFARDSGGSSGQYTQRSAPAQPPAHALAHPPRRTDSGSSTQHTHPHSHARYGSGYYCEGGYGAHAAGLADIRVSAPLQFQDGAPSPPPAPPPPPCLHYAAPIVSIHFQASAPPPQFQDERPYERAYPAPAPAGKHARTRDYTRFGEEAGGKQPVYAEPRAPPQRRDQDYVNSQTVCSPDEMTSPLGTFKRQRCLRYKQRRPRPILRSKSDISDRNGRYRREGRSPVSAPDEESSGGCAGGDTPDSSEGAAQLHAFFDSLGLEAGALRTLLSPEPRSHDSPVFFSDCDTVDSNQILVSTDYTVAGPQKPAYRNTEPPSVVERNARIIKWLCNCRKMQMAQ